MIDNAIRNGSASGNRSDMEIAQELSDIFDIDVKTVLIDLGYTVTTILNPSMEKSLCL